MDTAEFIRRTGPYRDWPPDAYAGVSAMVLAAVEKLPDLVRNQRPARSVGIAVLPGLDQESARDWQGRSIADGLEAVRKLTGAVPGQGADIMLGKLFWSAFLRAGYQGAVWVMDRTLAGEASL